MRKLFFLLLFILAAVGASARQDTLKYRISLKDKAATTYSLEHPEAFLSEKAIERRRKQNLPIDSTDLPVCRKYVDEIRRQGVKIVVTGKWENFVTVSCNDSALVERIAALPFVRETEKVWIAPGGDGPFMATERDSLINRPSVHPDSIYGLAVDQIRLSNGDKLHEEGFKGQGMTIAVIDAGFYNADKITAMQNIRILGTKDFVEPPIGYICRKQPRHGGALVHRHEPPRCHDRYGSRSFFLVAAQRRRILRASGRAGLLGCGCGICR